MTPPDWLKQRNGDLRPGTTPTVRLVTLDGHPHYRLAVMTAKGKFTCAVTQMNNGRRLDGGAVYESSDKALDGGLAELGEKLGWA